MTHAALSPEERAKRGIHDNLVRLSVGLEAASDLEADLLEALES
jgi:cystathionine beta-lyase/cystathionine gamma-synthase